MRVAGQVLQHMLGSTKRRLGVDHRLTPAQGPKQRVKGAWSSEVPRAINPHGFTRALTRAGVAFEEDIAQRQSSQSSSNNHFNR
jgi:hypothetical protein